ncbi:MAG: hypothetical protein RL199_523, partial [Pseudomonadota bacterium]
YVSVTPSTTTNRTCEACAAGNYSTTTNAGSCIGWQTCSAGYGYAAGTATTNSTCTACSTGTTSTGGTSSCTAINCAAGQYWNGSACTSCAAGYTSGGGYVTSCTDINECLMSNGGCSANATCTNVPGTRTCACNAGYTGNGTTCTAIYCSVGKYWNGSSCTFCASGYTSGGGYVTSCTDINECLMNNGGCSWYGTCTNVTGTRTCACNSGFAGNGVTCTDINECLTNNGGCSTHGRCMNYPGYRVCDCAPGLSGNGSTVDCYCDTNQSVNDTLTGKCLRKNDSGTYPSDNSLTSYANGDYYYSGYLLYWDYYSWVYTWVATRSAVNQSKGLLDCGNYFWSLGYYGDGKMYCKSRYCGNDQTFDTGSNQCVSCPYGTYSKAGFSPVCSSSYDGYTGGACHGWIPLEDAYQAFSPSQVYSSTTGSYQRLYWEDPVTSSYMTLSQAVDYCESLNKQPGLKAPKPYWGSGTSGTGWHLPTYAELQQFSLDVASLGVCASDPTRGLYLSWRADRFEQGEYWSSTPVYGNSYGTVTQGGTRGQYRENAYASPESQKRVRCVHY